MPFLLLLPILEKLLLFLLIVEGTGQVIKVVSLPIFLIEILTIDLHIRHNLILVVYPVSIGDDVVIPKDVHIDIFGVLFLLQRFIHPLPVEIREICIC